MNAMQEIESGNFSVPRWNLFPPDSVRVVSWNIDRGLKLGKTIEFLAGAKADIILLQEVDVNCRRTHRINVAMEIAQKLAMNYVFAREFEELTQGSKTSPAYRPSNTFALALIKLPHHPIPGNHFCSSRTGFFPKSALSGEAWRAPGAGQRRQYCEQPTTRIWRVEGIINCVVLS
jgi:endonuclease/exonuclease/phosphatase family metal-dependent hydrolase